MIILIVTSFTTCQQTSGPSVMDIPKEFRTISDELEELYRIDLLPQFRSNTISGQISSYDTTGGNNDGFSGLYSFQRKENGKLILADLKGPGVINRIWTPTPSEDTIEFYFDGEPQPRIKVRFIDLFSEEIYPFVHPVAGNEVGGYYCYVPIPFKTSCKIAYQGDIMYFHQIQYRLYEENHPLESFPVDWSEEEKNMLMQVCNYWNSKKPFSGLYFKDAYPDYKEKNTTFTLSPGESRTIFRHNKGGRIVKFEIQPPEVFAGFNKDIILEARWDDEPVPAINCPVADFFGYAYGNQSMQGFLMGSYEDKVYCYVPMPFDKNAEISLSYQARPETDQEPVKLSITTGYSMKGRSDFEGRFYAGWNREINPESGQPYVFLNAKGKGHLIGIIFQARGLRPGMTQFFEGDDSTVVDGIMRFHGTGSEDYFNGGWYAMPDRWDQAFSLPLHGCLGYSIPYSRTGGYRFYLTDKINWQKEILHTIEHGPQGNRYPVDYTSLAFYYSDTPPEKILQPVSDLRVVYSPDTLIFHPILMDLNLGLETNAKFTGWDAIMITGNNGGRVRLDLDELEKGQYNLFVTYMIHNKGGEFSVWQRQKKVSDDINTFSASERHTITTEIGEIQINDFYNSLTLQMEPPSAGKELRIHRLMFVK